MQRSGKDILAIKSYNFAVRIVKLYQFLEKKKRVTILARQIFRSGTNPGAMIREAKYSESPKDFIHKLHIALKETEETIYWLDLLFETNYITEEMNESLKQDAVEIAKLLTSSINTKKRKLKK